MNQFSSDCDANNASRQVANNIKNDVLIVFADEPIDAVMASKFANKGYRVVDSDQLLRRLDDLTEHLRLVVVIASFSSDCSLICQQIRQIRSATKLWILCVSNAVIAKDILELGRVYIEELLPKAVCRTGLTLVCLI